MVSFFVTVPIMTAEIIFWLKNFRLFEVNIKTGNYTTANLVSVRSKTSTKKSASDPVFLATFTRWI